MADSDAVRQRRRRWHKQGNHSLCRDGCQVARPSLKIAELPAATGENADPAAGLLALARRLDVAHQASPEDAALARVLKDTWLAVARVESSGDGGLEALLDDLSAT